MWKPRIQIKSLECPKQVLRGTPDFSRTWATVGGPCYIPMFINHTLLLKRVLLCPVVPLVADCAFPRDQWTIPVRDAPSCLLSQSLSCSSLSLLLRTTECLFTDLGDSASFCVSRKNLLDRPRTRGISYQMQPIDSSLCSDGRERPVLLLL